MNRVTYHQPNDSLLTFRDVAQNLQVTEYTLRHWTQDFAQFLGPTVSSTPSLFTNSDIVVLLSVQRLLEQGYNTQQVIKRLTPARASTVSVVNTGMDTVVDVDTTASPVSQEAQPNVSQEQSRFSQPPQEQQNNPQPETGLVQSNTSPANAAKNALPPAMTEVFSSMAKHQQAVLNNQTTMREMVNVVVQDNLSLKEENRKLRERMLEIERTFSEYQRRDETRKERLEGRLRALEGTMGALQQQMAQLVQTIRRLAEPRRQRGWFW